MSRANRLLTLTQALRRRRHPVTAGILAAETNVSERTIYRDVVALQAAGVPVRGEAGIGYILEAGYDLPPLMLTIEECEALMLGARYVRERADAELVRNVDDAIAKIEAVLPPAQRQRFIDTPLYAPLFGAMPRHEILPSDLRKALREGRKISIAYCNEAGEASERVVWPILISYFTKSIGLIAFCELRNDFRHFRTDRIQSLDILRERLPRRRAVLMKEWQGYCVARGWMEAPPP